jgi:hypothetical protein
LPDLLRRVAVLTVLSAVGIALLAPLTARSAIPGALRTEALLEAAEATNAGAIDRGGLAGRDGSVALSLVGAPVPAAPELLDDAAITAPEAAPMEATLYPVNVAPVVQVRPVPPPPVTGDTVTGFATWYCCSLGYRGQAVVALPGPLGGGYDAPPAARSVTVCADRCASLPVVDYCGCHWGTADQRVADLSPEAWAAISDAPRSLGVVEVTVHLES